MKQLKIFQKNNGLVVDGILGRNTILKAKEVFKIPTRANVAHFMGQLAHETKYFTLDTENLNYSVSGLLNTFRFYRENPNLAQLHGRKPGQKADQIQIANNVYSDKNRGRRYKLGNTEPGDGWKYRGRGAIMITGRANYEAFYKWKGICKETDPALIASKFYWCAALWFFEVNNVWRHANEVFEYNIGNVTKKINGGLNGFEHRKNLTEQYFKLIQ